MRLSLTMFFGKKPLGFKYRGKNRVVREIKKVELLALRKDYERTEKNMLILRHPYLTPEQSYGHMAHTKKEKMLKFIASSYTFKDEKFANHATIADRLSHLKVQEAWD